MSETELLSPPFKIQTTGKNNILTPVPYFICIRNGIHMKRGINDKRRRNKIQHLRVIHR
jgi:hypothetical protein